MSHRQTIYTDPEVQERFWALVNLDSGVEGEFGECWEWTGRTDRRTGYGILRVAPKRDMSVTRYAWRLCRGALHHLHLDHICHSASDCAEGPACPHRRCVNPCHLEPVTPRENSRRVHTNGKTATVSLRCPNGHSWQANTIYDADGFRLCYGCVAAPSPHTPLPFQSAPGK